MRKSLYGLKQAPRKWYKKFDAFIKASGYIKTTPGHCVFVKKFPDRDFVILLLYIDDMSIIGFDAVKIEKLKRELCKSFAIKDLGPTKNILGM